MKPAFGILAVILNLIGFVPYVRDILRNKVKPQRITWGIWTILTTIAFANQVLNGGGYSSYFFGSAALLVSVVFILSFQHGVGGSSVFDRVILGLAIVLFGYWFTVHNTRLSTELAVAIDAVGALPTILKAYDMPKTESYPQWVFAAIGGLFSLLAIEKRDYILFLYPVYIFIMNSIIVVAKYSGEHPKPKK